MDELEQLAVGLFTMWCAAKGEPLQLSMWKDRTESEQRGWRAVAKRALDCSKRDQDEILRQVATWLRVAVTTHRHHSDPAYCYVDVDVLAERLCSGEWRKKQNG